MCVCVCIFMYSVQEVRYKYKRVPNGTPVELYVFVKCHFHTRVLTPVTVTPLLPSLLIT